MTPGFETTEEDHVNLAPAPPQMERQPSDTSLSNSCNEDTGALSDQTIDYAEDLDDDIDANVVRIFTPRQGEVL